MQSGDRVVLRDGSLPRAVRASMAIPGVFTPVEINGHVLADGGMVENIPVRSAREMDADTVIAIDLQLPLGGHEQLETLTGVLSRAVSVMILQNERHSLALANATITVDTGNFSIADYDRVAGTRFASVTRARPVRPLPCCPTPFKTTRSGSNI